MASAAAVLFVRNDADDIGWWIAYHLAIGFDTLIICDDHSDDGTWDVIQNAAALYPVEPRRLDQSDGATYAERRSAAFSQAILSCRQRFDWVICLDSDEYVYPENHETIGSYLDDFSSADGITLNWCIYGSNGHIGRPAQGPISAYTKRAALDFPDHRAGKTFLRPETFGGHAVDGCHFAIGPDRHLRADGQVFDPSLPPNWQGARLLHFVTRNLTHYTRRLASLGTAQPAPDLWSHYNRNDEDDLAPQRFLPSTRRIASRLWQTSLDTFYWRLRQDIQASSLSFLPETALTVRDRRSPALPRALRYATLITETDAQLAYEPGTQMLISVAGDLAPAAENRVILVMECPEESDAPSDITTGILLLPSGDTSPLSSGACLMRWIPVDIDMVNGSDRASSARHADGDSVILRAEGLSLTLSGERQAAFEPDTGTPFFTRPLSPDPALEARLRPYLALRGHGNSLHDFCVGIDLLRAPHPDAMACVLKTLSTDAKSAMARRYGGFLPPWIAAA